MNRWNNIISVISAVLVAFLATAAFVLSFEALQGLALGNGIKPWLAALFPLVVDGAIVAASLSVLRNSLLRERTIYPWALVALFTLASVTFNVLHAQSAPLAQVMAAVPPVALLLSFELLMGQLRSNVSRAGVAAAIAQLEAAQAQAGAALADIQAQIEQAAAELAQTIAKTEAQVAEMARLDAQARAEAAQRATEIAQLAEKTEQEWRARIDQARAELKQVQVELRKATQELRQTQEQKAQAENAAQPRRATREEWRQLCAGMNGARETMTADGVNEILTARGFVALPARTADSWAYEARQMVVAEKEAK